MPLTSAARSDEPPTSGLLRKDRPRTRPDNSRFVYWARTSCHRHGEEALSRPSDSWLSGVYGRGFILVTAEVKLSVPSTARILRRTS